MDPRALHSRSSARSERPLPRMGRVSGRLAEPVVPSSAAPNPVAPPPASSLPQGTGQDGLARIRLEVPPGVKVTSEGKVLETGGVVMVPPGPVELKLQCTSIRARPFTYWIRVDEGSSSVQRFAVKCENQPLR